jgi:hypothetical protein
MWEYLYSKDHENGYRCRENDCRGQESAFIGRENDFEAVRVLAEAKRDIVDPL